MRWLAVVAGVMAVATQAWAANQCGALKGMTVDAGQIGLPTRGAVVTKAKEVGGGTGYCRVMGRIASVDPAADPIRFEVNLPERWNGKAVQFGGGSFDGHLGQSAGRGETAMGDGPGPLAQGYATFGSDSGHHHRYLLLPNLVNALRAKFALNDEERKNFGGNQLKKTHDVAVAVVKARFGAGPRRMYFVGGSTGGREAMMVVDRWPQDYDGVMAAYAAWNQIESDLQFIRVSQAIHAKDGWLPGSKTRLLRDTVLKACDAQDGLKDGIVSDPAGCHVDAAALRCADGKSHRGCLSEGQERTVEAFATPTVSDFTVENGMKMEPGYNVLRGTDLTGNLGLVHHAFHPPVILLNSFYDVVADGVLRWFLTRDPHYDWLKFDWKTGGPDGKWVAGIRQQSREDDASLADLTPFSAHGGKLLLVHGTADAVIPTEASVLLYQRIVEAMGQAKADEFLRLYLVPGFGHSRGRFKAGFDTVGTLDAWVEGQAPPKALVLHDENHGTHRARPACAWPSWPKYVGGDVSSAGSFACQ